MARSSAESIAILSFENKRNTIWYVAQIVNKERITAGRRIEITCKSKKAINGIVRNRYVDLLQSSYPRCDMSGNSPYSSTPVFNTEYAFHPTEASSMLALGGTLPNFQRRKKAARMRIAIRYLFTREIL